MQKNKNRFAFAKRFFCSVTKAQKNARGLFVDFPFEFLWNITIFELSALICLKKAFFS